MLLAVNIKSGKFTPTFFYVRAYGIGTIIRHLQYVVEAVKYHLHHLRVFGRQ